MPLPRPNLTNPVAGAELAAGRVLWLPDFQETGKWGSSPRLDVSGCGNIGNVSGNPVWMPGRGYGMVLDYDGTGDYTEVASSADFDSLACTFAVSFRTSMSTVGLNPWIFGRASDTATASANGFYCYLSATNAYISMQVKKALGVSVLNLAGTTSLNDGNWHRVHMVTTGATTTVSLYVDGFLIASGTPSSAWSWGSNPVRTAISTDTFWDPFDGEIGNEAIWSRPLTAAGVRLDVERELQRRAPVRRVVITQPFNDGGGTVVWDVAEYTVSLAAWTLTATGPATMMWESPAVAVDAGTWAFVITTPYSIVMTWENAPAFAVSLSAWTLRTTQAPSSIQNPLVPRVPRSNPPEAMTRFTEKVSAIINGVSRYGQIVQFGPTDYRLFGAAYLMPRVPAVTDDEDAGFFPGIVWINTSVTPRTVYMLTDATAGAATWLQL